LFVSRSSRKPTIDHVFDLRVDTPSRHFLQVIDLTKNLSQVDLCRTIDLEVASRDSHECPGHDSGQVRLRSLEEDSEFKPGLSRQIDGR